MYDQCREGAGVALSMCGGRFAEPGSKLLLDASERRILGVEMAPLSSGEYALLVYLGARHKTWFTTTRLSAEVYGRNDPAGRELVWKYASTLRRKIAVGVPDLIHACRRRGYCCRRAVVMAPGS